MFRLHLTVCWDSVVHGKYYKCVSKDLVNIILCWTAYHSRYRLLTSEATGRLQTRLHSCWKVSFNFLVVSITTRNHTEPLEPHIRQTAVHDSSIRGCYREADLPWVTLDNVICRCDGTRESRQNFTSKQLEIDVWVTLVNRRFDYHCVGPQNWSTTVALVGGPGRREDSLQTILTLILTDSPIARAQTSYVAHTL